MSPQPELWMTALKMLAALSLVLAGLLGGLFFLKRLSQGRTAAGRGRPIRVLASSYIGFKKHISLVEVPGAVLVLGITHDRITFLTRLAPDHGSPKDPPEAPSGESFAEHLSRWTGRFAGKGGPPS
jgi:flagellar biogenesis protein FliO